MLELVFIKLPVEDGVQWARVDMIEGFRRSNGSRHTEVYLTNGNVIWATKTPEEIMNSINKIGKLYE